jgi:hypothetical protein
MNNNFRMPNINFDSIVCGGGLDQITPTLSLKNGVARQAANFECGVTGGYVRIAGYERYDGHTSPSDGTVTTQMVSVATLVNTPSLAATITATGGKSATVAYVDGKVIGLCRITGTFALADVLMVGATTIGTIDNLTAGPSTPVQEAKMRNAVADIYRASIAAVPGAGAIRGVVEFKDVVYAFRDDATSTICEIYKSTANGWIQVVLLNSVSFTAGTTLPAEGGTLTQGSVTAVVRRVVRSSGAWTGSAAGRFIIDTPAGGTGNFTAGAATIGSTTITLAGAQTAITLLPGGKYEFAIANFTGATATERIYGVDGVNKAFEFDGTVFTPIVTGATTDTPSHVVSHRNYLFLALKSSIMYSAPGLPYDWTAIGGAGEIACGDDVTGMIAMPGGTTTPTLGIFSRENTYVLYGTGPTTFNFVAYNTGSGAVPFTVQNMAQTLAFDDRGAVSIQAAIQYGNFSQASITANVLPFINERLNKCTCATLNRRKSQYRIFFSDKYGLYITIVNGTPIGCMPVYFTNVVSCVYEGKLSTGEDINFFGSDNGMVYQLDKGTSFDGEPIEWQLVLNYSSAKSPRVLKRYRKAAVELAVQGSSYVDMFLGYALGYDSIEYEQMYSDTASLFLSNSDAYYTYLSTSRWDNFTWDNFFWDTRGLSPLEVSLSGTAENIALAFSGMLDYVQPFTINSIMIHYTPRRVMR